MGWNSWLSIIFRYFTLFSAFFSLKQQQHSIRGRETEKRADAFSSNLSLIRWTSLLIHFARILNLPKLCRKRKKKVFFILPFNHLFSVGCCGNGVRSAQTKGFIVFALSSKLQLPFLPFSLKLQKTLRNNLFRVSFLHLLLWYRQRASFSLQHEALFFSVWHLSGWDFALSFKY